MTSFVLKIIAIITMFIDHLGYAVFNRFSPLNFIGRISFPIFAFQISEGYVHTNDVKKYLARLFIFALISQIPFYLFINKYLNNSGLNIFFSLLLGLISIIVFDFIKNKISSKMGKFVAVIPVIFICILGEIINVDYGWWGVLTIFSFYFFKSSKLKMIIAFVILCIIRYGIQIILYGFSVAYIYLMLYTMFPIILIALYKGKQGKKIKYLSYAFYPIHLLLLYILF